LKQYYARNHKNSRFASVFHLHVASRHEKGLKSCEGVSLHALVLRTTSRY